MIESVKKEKKAQLSKSTTDAKVSSMVSLYDEEDKSDPFVLLVKER